MGFTVPATTSTNPYQAPIRNQSSSHYLDQPLPGTNQDSEFQPLSRPTPTTYQSGIRVPATTSTNPHQVPIRIQSSSHYLDQPLPGTNQDSEFQPLPRPTPTRYQSGIRVPATTSTNPTRYQSGFRVPATTSTNPYQVPIRNQSSSHYLDQPLPGTNQDSEFQPLHRPTPTRYQSGFRVPATTSSNPYQVPIRN